MTKNRMKKAAITMMCAALAAGLLAGCSGRKPRQEYQDAIRQESGNEERSDLEVSTDMAETTTGSENAEAGYTAAATELEVHFGDDGEPFTMHLEDNETAQAIARYVGTSDWRLPVYDSDDDVDYSVMEYYDIPSRYEIPSAPETVTEAKAGDVFYSDPNRIVLFYHDAEISTEYTKVGTFDATDDFIEAVENNPVLEGWGKKIILISQP